MSYVDAKQSGGYITYWYRDDQGILNKDSVKASEYYYFFVPSPNGEYRSIYGEQAARVNFKNANEYRNGLNQYEVKFESDISATYKFLSDEFHNAPENPLNIGLFDIEVDFDLKEGKGYPSPENPFGPINSISLYNKFKNTYYMIMLTNEKVKFKDDEENITINFYYCHNERQLLDRFIKLIKDIDILSAWYGDGFDIPYLVERLKVNYGDDMAHKLLCRDGFECYVRQYNDEYGNDKKEYKLTGRHHLDMMELYKNFTYEERDSYKLNNIVKHDLEKSKVEYEGDLGELYRNDPQKFFWYSFEDVRLLKQLEDKLSYINLAIQMSRQATIKYVDIFTSIKFIEHSVRNYAHFEKQHPTVLPDGQGKPKEPFPGGFIMDVNTGVYKWTMSIDLASLYPSIIRALNISPETLIMQCTKEHDDFIKVAQQTDEPIDVLILETNEVETMTAKELMQFIKESGFTISANGSIFTNDFVGIIPEVLETWVAQRAELKKKLKEAPPELKNYYDQRQHIKKISNNSTYGILSNEFSRFYDIRLAKSTTLTGQEIEKFQSKAADEIVDRYDLFL